MSEKKDFSNSTAKKEKTTATATDRSKKSNRIKKYKIL